MSGGDATRLATETRRVRLDHLTLLEKNARFMKSKAFGQLVANVKRDGCLTSSPLVYQDGDKLLVISGNHRVAAGRKAGIEECEVIQIVTPLSHERLVAIQLSHNAIVGEDDPNVLRELWQEIGLEWQEYSGVTAEKFDADQLDLSVLRVDAPFYEELHVSFLPNDRAAFERYLEDIAAAKVQPVSRLVARAEDFDLLFDALVTTKAKCKIGNAAIALRRMAELALERLGQIEDGK